MNCFFSFQVRVLKKAETAGSVNVKVKAFMERMLNYEVAMAFTWSGKSHNKAAFCTLKAIQRLILHCLKYLSEVTVSQKEATDAIHDFFLRAKLRAGREKTTNKE